ncbi:biotin-dependent carboxyltransferase family protein [Flavobacterium sp. ASW18X]|uniref:5-oxoprolinase subunit C family protein n=1 Tax=Flavobacterium sp. ASW18X TaxID=2572595 RepID=UPI0010AE4DC9|nr:biotin-dependent carboxyltransferase family protein [Flavobacterium sp. ASW18X]TKD65935.1 biotin-dependent carboxyltransferase family protein [Flavobacterium sp. ASW18X]
MIKVLKPGLYTSLQDKGRFGYRNKGVPVSGAMDSIAFEQVNMLLGNSEEATLIEITMTGPTLQFYAPTYICIGGANMSATLNKVSIENYKVYQVSEGDVIAFGRLIDGFRGYLGVKNGFDSAVKLGSRSQYYPITEISRLEANTELPFKAYEKGWEVPIVKIDTNYLNTPILEVSKGPEFRLLTDKQLEQLFSKTFALAKENNRMAYQLEEAIHPHEHSILTAATLPGTVQLTPAGKLIILMKDGQTTGGYPRVLQLSELAICVLAQKKYGDSITFKL